MMLLSVEWRSEVAIYRDDVIAQYASYFLAKYLAQDADNRIVTLFLWAR